MDRKYLKWGLIATWIFMVPAFLAVILYILTPAIISAILGLPSAGCGESATPYHRPEPGLGSAIIGLCSTTQAFLGLGSMLLIAIGFIPALISNILASLEAADSKMDNVRKGMWIILFWLVLGFFGVTAYYFTDRKKAST